MGSKQSSFDTRVGANEAARRQMADHELLDPDRASRDAATNGPPLAHGRRELDREDRSSPSPLAALPPPGRRERSLGVLRNDAESGSQLAPYAEATGAGCEQHRPPFSPPRGERSLRVATGRVLDGVDHSGERNVQESNLPLLEGVHRVADGLAPTSQMTLQTLRRAEGTILSPSSRPHRFPGGPPTNSVHSPCGRRRTRTPRR